MKGGLRAAFCTIAPLEVIHAVKKATKGSNHAELEGTTQVLHVVQITVREKQRHAFCMKAELE